MGYNTNGGSAHGYEGVIPVNAPAFGMMPVNDGRPPPPPHTSLLHMAGNVVKKETIPSAPTNA